MAVRPIDANKLKKELAPYEENNFSQQIDVILKIVDIQPTLTPPNEWVSVKDAMPPELKMVLVYCDGLYDVAGWVKNEDGEVCWTCKTSPNFWRQIPEME